MVPSRGNYNLIVSWISRQRERKASKRLPRNFATDMKALQIPELLKHGKKSTVFVLVSPKHAKKCYFRDFSRRLIIYEILGKRAGNPQSFKNCLYSIKTATDKHLAA